jgi:hypothetical protein
MRAQKTSGDPGERAASREFVSPTVDESHNSRNVSPPNQEGSISPVNYTVTDTALQRLIDALPKKPKPSRFWFLAHPLTVALIGGLVTALLGGVIGGSIAYYYNKKTQADARRQSVLDGINNARVPKLGELWEQLDADDLAINQLLDESTDKDIKNAGRDAKLHQIVEILRKDRLLVGRNRFWLGDRFFKTADAYLNHSIEICLSTIGDNSPDLTQLREEKDAARQDVIKIRDLFLEGNSNY